MKSLFVKATRNIMMAALTVAMSGVFTIIPSAEAQADVQSPCPTWLRIIDISSNNPHPIDWHKVVKGGIAGAYIKNTEATNYVNPFFTSDSANASKAGVPWGVYHFAQPGLADAVASARFFVQNGGGRGQLPPALDLEATKLSPAATAKWALTWLQTVQALTARKPIIYVGYYFQASQFPFLAPYDLWLPAYPNGYHPVTNVCTLPRPRVPAPWAATGWKLWQFTSIAHPSGMGGNVDLSAAETAWFTKWTGAGILPNGNGPGRPAAPLYSYGSHGTKVVEIQNILIKQGFLPKGAADGVFGLQTKGALEKYQVKIGVKGDGAWSVETQAASDFYIKNGHTIAQDKHWKAMGAAMKAKEVTITV